MKETSHTDNHTIHIKNMVCQRCIDTVADIFAQLDIPTFSIRLGEVVTNKKTTSKIREQLKQQLSERGFELLQDPKSALISKIKALIVEQVHYSLKPLTLNFSNFLADKLNHDYSYLSRLFSSVEGITIERYIVAQKMEKVKELLFYDQLTLSEIANQMNYSSVAYLSSQFKKETGMTPSGFKKQRESSRQKLDLI
ncbi:MAG: helix-turn-helix domain-containing protein [Cyclobacteriaceae bacterium]